jgi:hypothetical protein
MTTPSWDEAVLTIKLRSEACPGTQHCHTRAGVEKRLLPACVRLSPNCHQVARISGAQFNVVTKRSTGHRLKHHFG